MVRVLFLHPDLGIGGAERLVVDAGLALRAKNHDVHFVTCHHDPDHCFEETRDGSLNVTSVGDWLPRSIFGRCFALCAYIRMIYAALYIAFVFARNHFKPDVIICDQISACIPFLRLVPGSPKIVFYCHFPDQLLTQRKSVLKSVYRKPIDWFEEKTTGMADSVLVNSKFTAGVFHDTFTSLSVVPEVLYPSLNISQFDRPIPETAESGRKPGGEDTFVFLSINRYERKKNLPLALNAFSILMRALDSSKKVKLVMAGGYDGRVLENVEHHDELTTLAKSLNLNTDDVTFLKSPSDVEKLRLLKTSNALIYTPSGEHFGIVPIESMYCELPVIAVNDGGPTETVVDGLTGFLCKPEPESFAEAMKTLVLGGKEMKSRLGHSGKQRVLQNFAFQVFADKLDAIVRQSRD